MKFRFDLKFKIKNLKLRLLSNPTKKAPIAESFSWLVDGKPSTDHEPISVYQVDPLCPSRNFCFHS